MFIYERLHFSYLTIFLSGIIFPKIRLHVFVCDSETYIQKPSGNYFLGKSCFSYTKECFRNCLRNNFRVECTGSLTGSLTGVLTGHELVGTNLGQPHVMIGPLP